MAEKEEVYMAIQQTRRALEKRTERKQPAERESGVERRDRQYLRVQHQRDEVAEQIANGLGWFSIGLGLAELLAPKAFARLIGAEGKHTGLIRFMGLREITAGVGILTTPKPAGWVWSRVAGDAVDLACLSAACMSSKADRGKLTAATVAVLGVTALDIYNAQKLSTLPGAHGGLAYVNTVTVNLSPEEVYKFWRNFENLPQFMSHLESVRVIDDKRSHWVAKGPAGSSVEWDAEITIDSPNRSISWRSLEGADVENYGSVRFDPAPGNRGAEVRVELEYNPPAGALGAGIAKIFGEAPEQQIKGDLSRLKQVLETGEVVHSDASIHRGMHPAQPSEDNPGEEVQR
jgi:uncharacterized membrane protein